MFHDGDYYRISDKENILSLLDDIGQKIIWKYHQYFIRDNIILPRSLGQDTDTKKYTEGISGRRISHVRHSKGKQEDSTVVISLGCIKWNISDVAS